MKLFWMGTDSLMLVNYSMRIFRKKVYWWCFRRLIRVMDFFIDSHYCVSENVANNVRKFGTRKHINILIDPPKYTEKYIKIKHEEFNVLYYFPAKVDQHFNKWLYGYDLFEQLKKELSSMNFIVVDGKQDLSSIYPIVDFYIRPNRHDGHPRIIIECDIQDIPYYWSIENPDYNKMKNDIIKALNQ